MRLYRSLLIAATLLALVVIPFGAYVRLSDAGLGCPDWPGCYGHLIGIPDAPHEKAAALEVFPDKPIDIPKAWKEMTHRYLAGLLGLLIALIAGLSWMNRCKSQCRLNKSPTLPTILFFVIVLQALLGMWTVTLSLKPVIVSAHLLGGMTTLALLLCLLFSRQPHNHHALAVSIRLHAALALLVVAAQITLGGWVSSNYAALACSDFPTCGGTWLPEMDFTQAFRLHRELGLSADGNPLPFAALTAIHWAHRAGALVVAAVVGTLALTLITHPAWRRWGLFLGTALLVQIGLGIATVLFTLPLPIAVAHNAGAAALLSVTLIITRKVWQTNKKSNESSTGAATQPISRISRTRMTKML